MTDDARFEDAVEQPLRLSAEGAEDVVVMSALLQDAVFTMADVKYDRKQRELAFLLNRFRWEDDQASRPAERVRSVLLIRDVESVCSQGVDRSDDDLVMCLLEINFEPSGDGAGEVLLTLAGDGTIRAVVECANLVVHDVTRPYLAPSGKRPHHPD